MTAEGLGARETALEILAEQERSGAYLKDLLARPGMGPAPADRPLVQALVYGVIRHRTLLDYNIDRLAPRAIRPPILRHILRLGVYQIHFLDAVPDYASVNLCVELAKRKLDRHKGGFVNAALKRAAREGLFRHPGADLKAMSVNLSHPLWLLEKWQKRMDRQNLVAALRRNIEEPPLWVRRNALRAGAAELEASLAAMGFAWHRDADCPEFYLLEARGGAVLRSAPFAEGKLSFQDPSSCLAVRLLDWRPPHSVLDLCSAPGGKAASLAESEGALKAPAPPPIFCNDISFARLRRIRDHMDRLGHANLRPLAMDPARPALKRRFDRLLVDAPCSNLGVIRRRPEAKWRHTPQSLSRLAALQKALLRQAVGLASDSACMVYATCSPEEEETMEVIGDFLQSHPAWRLEDASRFLPRRYVREGCLWIFPGETEGDGFFAARLMRKEETSA